MGPTLLGPTLLPPPIMLPYLVVPVVQDELENGCVESAALHQSIRHRLEEVGGDKAQRGGQVRLLLLLVNHLGRGEGGQVRLLSA